MNEIKIDRICIKGPPLAPLGSKSFVAVNRGSKYLVEDLLLCRCQVEDLLEGVLDLLLVEAPGEEGSRRLWRCKLNSFLVDDANAVVVVAVGRWSDPAEHGNLFRHVAFRRTEILEELGGELATDGSTVGKELNYLSCLGTQEKMAGIKIMV